MQNNLTEELQEFLPEQVSQTGSEPDHPAEAVAQTGTEVTESDGLTNQNPKKTRKKKSESDEKTEKQINNTANPENNKHTKPGMTILTIDEKLSVETEADKAKSDLLDLIESFKSGRILSGTIQGIERVSDEPNRSLAVIYHGEFKIIIPAEEAVEPPQDYRGKAPGEVLHYMLTKRMGAEVDYIIKGIDPKAGIAVGSRLEAMRSKRKQYYMGTDRDGNFLVYSGICAEARVISVIRSGIFVELFGLEVYIPLRELSYQRLLDAAGYFRPGQRILVKILEVDRSDKNQIRVMASVKQAGENPYEKALKKYSVDNCYVGTVSVVDTNGIFVALDGGIDCLCSYPRRGRPPRGARVTVRVLGINYETNRIWGAITHTAAAR